MVYFKLTLLVQKYRVANANYLHHYGYTESIRVVR